MKSKLKVVMYLLTLCFTFTLLACGNNAANSSDDSTSSSDTISSSSSKSSKVDIDEAVKCYVDSYLGKDNGEYAKSGVSKDIVSDLVCRRNCSIISLYGEDDARNEELLKAYYEGLNKVEYNVKSSNGDENGGSAVITIKGLNISGIENEARSYRMQVKREKKMSHDELKKASEDKAIELLKAAQPGEEKEIELKFNKNSDGKLELSEDSINSLENTISFVKDGYTRFTGDVPQAVRDLKLK